jgi:hypothetical protein
MRSLGGDDGSFDKNEAVVAAALMTVQAVAKVYQAVQKMLAPATATRWMMIIDAVT